MKKFLSLLLVVTMLVTFAVAFTSCGKKADVNEGAANDDAKVIKMGTNAAFPPYEFKEGEEFKGIDVDIATAIAKYTNIPYDKKISPNQPNLLANGKPFDINLLAASKWVLSTNVSI